MRFDEATSSQRVLLRALSTFKDVVQSDVDYQRRPPRSTGRASACVRSRRPVKKGHAAARPLPYEGGGALISSEGCEPVRSISSTETHRNV